MIQLLAVAAIAVSVTLSGPVFAGPGHEHEDGHSHHHAPNTPEFVHKDYGSVADAWSALIQSVKDAEAAVKESKFGSVHEIYPELAASVHYLSDHSELEDAGRERRLKAALDQLAAAIESFHEYSHSSDDYAKEAIRELKKINGAMKLIENYYPAGSLVKN